jgi:hypothetical protein
VKAARFLPVLAHMERARNAAQMDHA